LARILIT
jgi:hypothetical protein